MKLYKVQIRVQQGSKVVLDNSARQAKITGESQHMSLQSLWLGISLSTLLSKYCQILTRIEIWSFTNFPTFFQHESWWRAWRRKRKLHVECQWFCLGHQKNLHYSLQKAVHCSIRIPLPNSGRFGGVKINKATDVKTLWTETFYYDQPKV